MAWSKHIGKTLLIFMIGYIVGVIIYEILT